MSNTALYEIRFSFDQPGTLLDQLLPLMQRRIAHLHSLQKVVIIDSQVERARFLNRVLGTAGYLCIVVPSALDAFRLFLQGSYLPLIIIITQEPGADRLFLSRLIQQASQRLQSDVALVRLFSEAGYSPPRAALPAPAKEEQRTPVTDPLEYSPAMLPRTVEKVLLEGIDIGRYHILNLLGGGLLGNVYKAYDRLREQHITLKAIQTSIIPYEIMRVSVEDVNLFQQEVDLLKPLGHPNVLLPMNVGKSYISGTPFIYKTMPYYEAGSLKDWLNTYARGKPFTPQETAHIILPLAEALQSAHDHNVLYQNFKLTNILVSRKAESIRELELLWTDIALTQDGSFFSDTPEAYPYMAPERWYRQSLPASDQYGLAILAYELLAGRPPFQGNASKVMKHLHSNIPPQPPSAFQTTLPPALDHVILRALSKRADERFVSIETFARTLQQYCYW